MQGVNEHSLPFAILYQEDREVVIRILLNKEGLVNINARPWDFNHGTALETACCIETPKKRRSDIVRLLLAKGVDVNANSSGLYSSP